ncbi:MAG: PQQ-dependent sugar dehydrogenase [Gemmatimonadetes bacterium]|nr:PQQ-dependent sugar dehydrogenase [Gemmatimonadota bacterium]
MRGRTPFRPAAAVSAAIGLVLCSVAPAAPQSRLSEAAARLRCDGDNGGITLPAGFCAVVVADTVGRARHLVVAANGDVFVALANRRDQQGVTLTGGVLALRDTTGDGRADVRVRFGPDGGTGIALVGQHLYFATDDAVLRYALPPDSLQPVGLPDTVVAGLPVGGHRAKSIALDGRGSLYVNIGSRTNACQVEDRQPASPGIDPCPELEVRAGIWRFEASRKGQTPADGERFSTGLRNVVALALHAPSGTLYGAQHGRDQLFQNWPAFFTAEASAEKPSEEFVRLEKGDDFGWPYCYHDAEAARKLLAPEYGGDGRKVGRCAQKKLPLLAFPGHWAPNGLVFYTRAGSRAPALFPAAYRGGAFIAFHGSWNRAPLPQQGYKVVFLPFRDGLPTGAYETFADGFAGGQIMAPGQARHRPTGLAVGADGSLYVTDDAGGRIWRVLPAAATATTGTSGAAAAPRSGA